VIGIMARARCICSTSKLDTPIQCPTFRTCRCDLSHWCLVLEVRYNLLTLSGACDARPSHVLESSLGSPRPCFCHNQLPSRLLAPRVAPDQLHEAALGRAFVTLEADRVTARDSLLAATAVERWGLAPRIAPRDRPRVHVNGRSSRGEEPEPQVMQRTRGESRDGICVVLRTLATGLGVSLPRFRLSVAAPPQALPHHKRDSLLAVPLAAGAPFQPLRFDRPQRG
jgi:hypothetical protein